MLAFLPLALAFVVPQQAELERAILAEINFARTRPRRHFGRNADGRY